MRHFSNEEEESMDVEIKVIIIYFKLPIFIYVYADGMLDSQSFPHSLCQRGRISICQGLMLVGSHSY